MKSSILLAASLTSFLLLNGCASTQSPSELAQQAEQRNAQFLLVQTAMTNIEQRLSQAEQENLAYFSPAKLKKAIAEYDDAEEDFQDIRFEPNKATLKQTNKIIAYVQTANQYLDTAWEIKKAATSNLADSFEQFARLDALDVKTIYPKSYQQAKKRLDDLVESIADGNIAKAQDKQATLLITLSALEVKAVKEIKLSKLNSIIKGLNKIKAAKYIPISYQKAIASKERAEAVITASPRDGESINKAVALAEFDLLHSQNIMVAVKNLKALDNDNLEAFMLNHENELETISSALGLADLRNLTIKEQIATIATKSTETVAKLAELTIEKEQLLQSVEDKNNLLLVVTGDKNKLNQDMIKQITEKDQQLMKVNEQLAQLALSENNLTQALTKAKQEFALLEAKIAADKAKQASADSAAKLQQEKSLLEQENKVLKSTNELEKLNQALASRTQENQVLMQENKKLQAELASLQGEKVEEAATAPVKAVESTTSAEKDTASEG